MALSEKMSEDIEKEYDSAFDGQEKIENLLSISSDAFTTTKMTIGVREIGLSEPVKKGRTDTIIGLTQTIAELGVLTPIHVMTIEQYDDSDPDSYKYTMIEGTRRLYGAIKSGKKEIDAVVWDFKDKDVGRSLALPLGLMLNRHERRRWKEVWELYQILELSFNITPGTLEFLLQLEAGDAMKLKDCMLCDYTEVKEMLLSGTKSLEQAYKQLQKLRKEENKLAKEEETGLANNIEGAEEVVSTEEAPKLSDDEVSSILELEGSMSDEELESASVSDLDMSQEINPADAQKVGERHPLDPALRKAVLVRDKSTCQCCGLSGELNMPVFTVHHIVNVAQGGKDTMENLVTVCQNCHMVIHVYCMGDLHVSKESVESMSEAEQMKLKNIMKYGNISIKAGKLRGMKAEDIRNANKAGASHHAMPKENLKANREAFESTV